MVADSSDVSRIENAEIELFRDNSRVLSDAELRQMDSFDDVMRMAEEIGATVLDSSDYVGSGAELLSEKERLVGIAFVITQWRFNASTDFEGAWFVSANIVTKHGEKLVLNDGSMGGIRDQLHAITQSTGQMNFLAVKNGLVVSEYEVIGDDGKTKKAKSYYLSS